MAAPLEAKVERTAIRMELFYLKNISGAGRNNQIITKNESKC
jgi:hypothetical protein